MGIFSESCFSMLFPCDIIALDITKYLDSILDSYDMRLGSEYSFDS